MKLQILLLTFILFLFLFPTNARAASYYVSTTGDDANNGSQSTPWKTIQKAADTMVAGDTVSILPGNYSTERVKITKSGASGSPITYQAQGIVTSKGFTVTASFINIRGFEISVNTDQLTEGVGIHSTGNNNIIENNKFHDCAWGGINISGNSDRSIVRNNYFYHVSQWGIQVAGTNHLVENNEVVSTIQYFPGLASPAWVDADGMRFFGSGHIFRGNSIHDIVYDGTLVRTAHIDCFQTWGGNGHTVASNVLFERNFCSVPVAGPERAAVGKAFMIQGDAPGAYTEPVVNITIRNNVLISVGGIFTEYIDHLVVENNTVIGVLNPLPGAGFGVVLNSNCSNAVVKNNIFQDVGMGAYTSNYIRGGGTNLSAGYNDVFMSNGTNPVGSPYPNDLWKVVPQFVNPAANDYHLKSTSPCINKGATLSDVTIDYDGIPRPQPPGGSYDIGAYEYGGIPGPSPSLFPTPSPVVSPSPVPTPSPLPSPSVLPGLSWQAEVGTLSSIFQIGNSGGVSYVFQSTKTDPNPSAGGLATYRFNIPSTGDYVIKTIVNAPDVDTNSFYVNIDAEPTHPGMIWDILPYTTGFAERTISWRGTGTQDANQYNPKVFTLTAGIHTLYIRGREANVQLDSLRIESNSPACKADLSGDKTVNLADIVSVLSKWGQTGTLVQDINGDGVINLADLQYILTNWGKNCI